MPWSLQDQLMVSTWATKTVLVLEFLRRDYHVNDADDRHFLKDHQQPPTTYRVRLAKLDEIPQQAFRFQTIVATNDLDTKEPNILCSTLLIGHLIIQIWGGPGMSQIDLRSTGSTSPEAIIVWPPTPIPANWPPLRPIKEDQVEEFLKEPIPNRLNDSFLTAWSTPPPGSGH